MTDGPRRYISEIRCRAATKAVAETYALEHAAGHLCERTIRIVEAAPISENFAAHISGAEQAWLVAVEIEYDEARRWALIE